MFTHDMTSKTSPFWMRGVYHFLVTAQCNRRPLAQLFVCCCNICLKYSWGNKERQRKCSDVKNIGWKRRFSRLPTDKMCYTLVLKHTINHKIISHHLIKSQEWRKMRKRREGCRSSCRPESFKRGYRSLWHVVMQSRTGGWSHRRPGLNSELNSQNSWFIFCLVYCGAEVVKMSGLQYPDISRSFPFPHNGPLGSQQLFHCVSLNYFTYKRMAHRCKYETFSITGSNTLKCF